MSGRAPGLPLLTVAEMRRWDRGAVQRGGVPEPALMEAAGRAAATVLARHHPEGPVWAAVGPGKNGGDALILLRTLAAGGREVRAMLLGEADRGVLHGWEIPVERGFADGLGAAGVIVDGLLGTGARGAPRPEAAAAIDAINGSGRPVLALDGPSGVDLDTGRVEGAAVRADVTVTFGAAKRGLLLPPGRMHAGRIVVVEVGFPPLPDASVRARLVDRAWAAARLPEVAPDAHKGRSGTVAVVAGRSGMAGAAVMVGMGALRSGAGMVRILSEDANRAILQQAIPEALFTSRESGDLDAAFAQAAVIVAGPGMGTDEASRGLLARALRSGSTPCVLDADGLTLLSRDPELRGNASGPLLLTPHPGEMARLLSCEVAEILADPFEAAGSAARQFECAVLLKGFPSIVAAPGGSYRVVVEGHSGTATGGMGDTLSGVAGALLAREVPPEDAGALALYLAGRAADLAGLGRGLLPRDVAEALPRAFGELARTVREARPPFVLLDLPPAR